jgi:hypothetical protein
MNGLGLQAGYAMQPKSYRSALDRAREANRIELDKLVREHNPHISLPAPVTDNAVLEGADVPSDDWDTGC